MKSSIKAVLLTMSIAAIVITFVFGSITPVLAQTPPATGNLVKRNYSYFDDQHLTVRFGNNRVCGDHLCAPGEWAKLQENLSQAQITHPPTNSTKVVSVSTNTTSTTSQTPSQPPSPSVVCVAVKAALANSAVPSATVTKIMLVLGCNN